MSMHDDGAFARDTIDDVDLAKYDRLGAEWWNPKGPMRALHKFNPVRVGYIRDLLAGSAAAGERPNLLAGDAAAGERPNLLAGDAAAGERPNLLAGDAAAGERPNLLAGDAAAGERPLQGCRILDVGSGGGILCESLARLGAAVVGIDPAPNNIAVAARHAAAGGLPIDYRCTTVETLAKAGESFDAVLVMEVVEHVRDVSGFLRDAAACVRPGGLMVGATLNRTAKSYALAIVGAEYVLGWLPRGTHDWRQFVTPAEFKAHMARAGLRDAGEAGVTYNPLTARWSLGRDLGVNYMVAARRPG